MMSIVGLVFLALASTTTASNVKIGVVRGPGSDKRENNPKFWTFGQNISPSIHLEPVNGIEIHWWSETEVAKAVCKLAKEGANAITVQAPPRLTSLVSSYTDNLQMPLVTTMDIGYKMGKSQVNLLPDTVHAAAALLKHWDWKSFAFVYDTDTGAGQLEKLLSLLDRHPQVEPFLKVYTSNDALAFLLKTPPNVTKLVMATSETVADELFIKLAVRRRMHGILLKPVGMVRTINITTGFLRLTKFSFVEDGSKQLLEFENRWKTLEERTQRSRDKEFPDSALLYSDTSRVFHNIFEQENVGPQIHREDSFDCFNYSAAVSFQKDAITGDGVTGSIHFNEEGRRIGYKLNVVEPSKYVVKKIATWSDDAGLNSFESPTRESAPTYAAQQSDKPPIRVVSVLASPYLMKNENGQFEGFIVDLIQGFENMTDLHFIIHLSKDSSYGYLRNNTWTGMIGELLKNESDVALADLTVTPSRSKVIHFSRPFRTTGLRILVKRTEVPQATSFGAFSFLTVWPLEVWLVILLAVVVFSVTGYFISRFIGAPDRVRALESKGTDSLSPCGSFWFTISSLFQRDTGIYPRTFTHRLWAILWWTFCFFVMASYISALTSALIQTRQTITSTYSRKTSQELLKDLMTKGWPTIGTIGSGSTTQFFKSSTIGLYRDFGNYLKDNPDVMIKSSSEGIARVRDSNGSYAFVTDSPAIEYEVNQEPCDIVLTSGYLSSRVFAPAMRKDSDLKEKLDKATLNLIEDGTLRRLYEKWWHLNTHCEDPNMNSLQHVYSSSTNLHEVSGIFYVLCIGMVCSVITFFIEKYLSRKARVTLDQ